MVANALQFALLVYPRPGELRQIRWSEIDLKAGFWNAPAETMKMKRPLLVPLSSQVVELLETMMPLRSRNPYVFHSLRTHSGMLSENTPSKALKSIGVTPADTFRMGFDQQRARS
jgi:integrase